MKWKDQMQLPEGRAAYKGNLHSHTVLSDGHLTACQAAQLYRIHGYHFLCLSEHDLYTDHSQQLDREDFLIFPGLEASANLFAEDGEKRLKCHHMNGILGTKSMQQAAREHFTHMERLTPACCEGSWDGAKQAQKLCDQLRSRGCLVTYNHPIWSRVEPDEVLDLDGIWALEIYNYGTVNESGTGADTTFWNLALRRGKKLYAFASDDNHNNGLFDDCLGGWIEVFSEKFSRESILQAMLNGEFYSSSGPKIYGFGVKNNQVYLHCSACERINFICGGYLAAGETFIAQNRDGLQSATLLLHGKETYVRAECVDWQGKVAWTNPLFLTPEKG